MIRRRAFIALIMTSDLYVSEGRAQEDHGRPRHLLEGWALDRRRRLDLCKQIDVRNQPLSGCLGCQVELASRDKRPG